MRDKNEGFADALLQSMMLFVGSWSGLTVQVLMLRISEREKEQCDGYINDS
jgi:hypothetical protein